MSHLIPFKKLDKTYSKKLKVVAKYLQHLGPLGLFLIAIADSFPIPTFGGPDILVAVFSARHHSPWYEYAGIATLGSVIGALLVFRMAHKAGVGYLHRKFGADRVARILEYFEQWGAKTLIVSTTVPAPFPTSALFATAGVVDYPLRTFILVVALGRALRYGTIALLSHYYGRRFIAGLQHPGQHYGWIIGIALIMVILMSMALVLKKRFGKVDDTP